MGSKPFSQISFEQVMTTLTKLITYLNIYMWPLPNATLYCCLLIWNQTNGQQPIDLDLWMTTHTKDGQ